MNKLVDVLVRLVLIDRRSSDYSSSQVAFNLRSARIVTYVRHMRLITNIVYSVVIVYGILLRFG